MMVNSTSPSCPFTLATHISPTPSIGPFSTPSLCPLVSKRHNQLHFLTLHPQLSHPTSLLLYSWYFLIVFLLFFLMFFNIFPWQLPNFSGLLPAHFFLRARHPLQVALSTLNMSNTLCLLHLQHCFFSTSSTTISPHAIPCFLVVKCPPHTLSPHYKYS